MAFGSAAGYNNLPNGNWSPTIYSKLVQLAFRKKAVVQDITNTDYFGEISEYGDTVKIIKEPNITVSSYVRGQSVQAQDLDDDEITLTIDQADKFAFKVDDIETKMSHVNWEALASSQAGYRVADKMDQDVFTYITTIVGVTDGEVDLSANKIGTTSNPIELKTDGTQDNSASFSALSLMNRFMRLLDEQNTPEEGRWFVADPVFYEKLNDESSKLMDDRYVDKGILRNGKIAEGMVRGFRIYKSNNLPSAGSGPAATTSSDYGWVLAGHDSAIATAEAINKVEKLRDPDSFADVVRGLHMYGRKVLRPEALVGAIYHSV